MSNVWFTSDTHFGHANIVRGTSKWGDSDGGVHGKQRTRNFDTLEEHDETLIDNINKLVLPGDTLYHLGDWSFGGLENVGKFRRKLNCKNIHLIYGNHDHHIERNRTVPNLRLVTPFSDTLEFGKPRGGLHDDDISTRDLFSSCKYYFTGKICGQSIVTSHYAMRTWDKGHHGTWMLFGHSHGTLSDYEGTEMRTVQVNKAGPFDLADQFMDVLKPVKVKFKTMDVGIDTHPEFRPYHFDEIAAIMKDRVNLKVDHHNETTS